MTVAAAVSATLENTQAARPATTELLRSERTYDFVEAWIAAQRVPPRHQFQFAIADVAGRLDDDGELFAGEIFFSNPRCNHCEVSGEVLPDERIFLQRRSSSARRPSRSASSFRPRPASIMASA